MQSLTVRFVVAALAGAPMLAAAQGTLSTQGFGFPAGQHSTRSLATGGALGDIDPYSAINPSSILGLGGSTLYFQAEPEYRVLSSGTTQERATIARYPLVSASIPLGARWMAGIGVSNLLDRSFKVATRAVQTVGGTQVGSTNTFSSDGAIGDVRLALAWSPVDWLRLGVAGHAITGDNRLASAQVFDDSARYAPLVDSTTVTYVGTAYSAGVQLQSPGGFNLAGSYRRGGTLTAKRADTTLSSGRVPDRMSFSAAYTGIRGTTLAVRTAKDKWSNMSNLLTTTGTPISDAWDTSVGADVLGPALFGSLLQLRAGARDRLLPFGVPAEFNSANVLVRPGGDVKERSYAFGVGTPLARGRATLDITGTHAARTSTATALTESAWTLSVGIMVRP
jgi:hypothetical protein